jgi:heat shock protein HtpX
LNRMFWKSWAFVLFTTLLILTIGWIWFRRDGLLWTVPIVLGINYFLLIHSGFRVVEDGGRRQMDGNDSWSLNKTLAALCTKAAIPLPKLVVIEAQTPQAFLLGRFSSFSTLYVTQGLLDRLNENERQAVLALEVATLKAGLQFNFLILGAFFDLIFTLISSADRFICWIFGTKRRWAQSVAARLAWPLLFLVQRWCLSPQDYYRLDAVAAELCADPDALCQALWKLEATSLTQPLNVHPAWTHVFAVGPSDRRGPFGYLQPQPSAKLRILKISGGEYPV